MKKDIKALIVEDSEDDVVLLLLELKQQGFEVQWKCVQNAIEMKAAINEEPWDVVISDYNLPQFSAPYALKLLQDIGLDIPFIVVSGTIGEDLAVETMRHGAHDYLMKNNFYRLGEAISRAIRDAEERKKRIKLEEELFNASARWEDTFNALDDMIAIIGSDMKIVQSNKAFKNAVGTNDVTGKYCYKLFHGTDSPPRYCRFAECVKTGKCIRFENYEQNLDGKWFEYSITPLQNCNGDLKQFIMSLKDIDERKKMENQALEDQKLESIGRLAAGIAHEINTPTQYVGDNIKFLNDAYAEFTELMAKYKTLKTMVKDAGILADLTSEIDCNEESSDLDFLNEEIPNALSQSVEGIKRITEIVSAMKEFSHPGSDEKTLSDINSGISTTITVCRNEWKYVADLKTSLQPDLPMIPLLQGEFNQVILNIIVNAAHAIGEKNTKENQKEKGLIKVSSALKNMSVEVRISDTGGGIPEGIKKNIFDPFFTTKPVGVGTGQGLAIARNVVVNKHGGTLELDTKDGAGSTFIINLPLK